MKTLTVPKGQQVSLGGIKVNEFKTLAQICKDLNISRKVIQGYERHGLVSPYGKDRYGHLIYDKEMTQRIIRIRFYQNLEFSIREIQGIIDKDEEQIRKALIRKKEEIETRMNSLKQKQDLIDSLIKQNTESEIKTILKRMKEEDL